MTPDEFLAYYRGVHAALHRCWTKAVDHPGYQKSDWLKIDNALSDLARDAANALGIKGPLLLVAFQRWVIKRHDKHTTWEEFYGRAGGEPRKLGDRRVSLPLFPLDVTG